MDAHLFRLFCEAARPSLEGARIEKIQEPAKGLLTLSLFSQGRKFRLYFYMDKKNPFCFLHEEKLSADAAPSAQVMRLRRYFDQKRIVAVVCQYFSRKLWLLGASGETSEKAPWLCLDLARGASLHFLSPEEAPRPENAIWPSLNELPEALENWRDYPVLTPPLRKALKSLESADQAALMTDLEAGGGDVFLILTPAGKIVDANAWPSSAEKLGANREEASSDIMDALGRAGMEIVVGGLAQRKREQASRPFQKRLKRLDKLLEKLDQDEARLKALGAREQDALRLRAILWRLPQDYRSDKLIDEDGTVIALDPRFSVAENMERLFGQVRKSRRGLKVLAERRKNILEEKAALSSADEAPISQTQERPGSEPSPPIAKILPKNIQAFRSSDGYLIMRGKDARGNLAMRKNAASYDYWLHVENGPGAHVVIRRKNPIDEVPARTIDEAASLAANKSWLAEASSASVNVAELRHIKPVRKGPPGMVIIDKVKFTVLVAPDKALEESLAER